MALLSETSLQAEYRNRLSIVTVLTVILFGLLLGRMWYLQILSGNKFREFSEKNRINIKVIPAMRGRILDRNGVVIAESRPSFDLLMTPSRLKGGSAKAIDALGALLSWDEVERREILAKLRASNVHDPVVVKRDMGRDELAKIMVRLHTLSGVDVVAAPARAFPFGVHGSHLLGYLGEINKDDLKPPYRLGDVWGISGVEKTYEAVLRGQPGARPFVEDAWGRELGEELSDELLPAFQPKDPIPGDDLVLAIDSRVQEAAETSFTQAAGAVVAIDPNNGDVLALVSRPEYAPENFVRGVSSKYWSELMKDPLNPLYDRALRGLYPPGSTFKSVTALAALINKVTDPNETVFCNGSYRLGREVKRCWKKEGHGVVNLHRAIKESCDVYFYEMGRRIGIERLADVARSLGMGQETGIGINREEKGLVPNEAWKRRVYKQPWVGGETLSVAIGQGALQVTPIQMAVSLATLVNGGTIFQPRIALRTQNDLKEIQQSYPVVAREKVSISDDYRSLIMEGLRAVVQEPGGTAYWAARSKLVPIAGKTGTAQVVNLKWGKLIDDHALFVAFAPTGTQAKIVVAVIVENGGHGGVTAAPIAKNVIEAYLGGTS